MNAEVKRVADDDFVSWSFVRSAARFVGGRTHHEFASRDENERHPERVRERFRSGRRRRADEDFVEHLAEVDLAGRSAAALASWFACTVARLWHEFSKSHFPNQSLHCAQLTRSAWKLYVRFPTVLSQMGVLIRERIDGLGCGCGFWCRRFWHVGYLRAITRKRSAKISPA